MIREKQLQEEYAKKQFEMKADLVRRTQLQIQQQQQLMREKRKLQKAGKFDGKTVASPLVKFPQQTTQRVLFPRPQVNPRVSPGTNEILASLQMQGMYFSSSVSVVMENIPRQSLKDTTVQRMMFQAQRAASVDHHV